MKSDTSASEMNGEKTSTMAFANSSAGPTPLALYIHVPFCRRRCAYCHFDIKVLHRKTDPVPFYRTYIECLTRELQTRAARFRDRILSSIYYGGGTPSRLAAASLEIIQSTIARSFRLESDCEISMEVNPEDGNADYLKAIGELGITRVSFGVQSFHEPSLRAVNRPHGGQQALAAIAAAPTFAGGISLDLMLGLPFQDFASLEKDLEHVAALAPNHLSVYMLERDLPTPLDKSPLLALAPDEDRQADFYERVLETLSAQGYTSYEISNFSRPGFECRHNLTYWRGGDYLGVGPAAHGRVGLCYSANYPALSPYAAAVRRSGLGVEREETWTRERLRQEMLVQGLRLREGIAAKRLTRDERNQLEGFLELGLVDREAGRIFLTTRGRLLANEVFQVFVEPNPSS